MARQWQAEYQLILTTDTGSRLDDPFTPIGSGFTATKKANTISPCMVELPHDSFFRRFTAAYPREYMLQVWRKPVGGTMKLFNVYLLTKYRRQTTPTPHGTAFLYGFDMNLLLYRRIVAGMAGSTEARLTEEADDMMKTLMTNALSDADDPTPTAGTRAWGNLTVGEKTAAGPSLTLDLEYEKLLTFSGGGAFKKIVNASREAGTDLFFEVQPNEVLQNSINFIFNTFTTQIGRDLTDEVLFSIANSTIINAFQEYDYSEAENYIYAGGKGEDADRKIEQSYEAADYLRGTYTRSEGFLDAPSIDDDSLQNAADAELYDKRRTIKIGGQIVDTPQLRLGRDFNFGDLVTAKIYGDQYDALINSVTVGMKDGKELVQIGAEYRL